MKTLKTVAEKIRTGWSSGSSDSSDTGFKEKPAGVLRTDLRRGANCVTDSLQGKVYDTDRLRVPTDRWQSFRRSWMSSSTSLRNWYFNQLKNSVLWSSETSLPPLGVAQGSLQGRQDSGVSNLGFGVRIPPNPKSVFFDPDFFEHWTPFLFS